jgi:4'-phosphopantetheinyl transferase
MTGGGAAAVRVWLLDLELCAPALRERERQTPRLAPDEAVHAASLKDKAAAERWLLARIALRLILESELGPDVRRCPFAVAAGGKPVLPGTQFRPLDFSVSRSGLHALIGISTSRVGVDLEVRRRIKIDPARAEGLIAAAEALMVEDERNSRAEDAPLRAWVRLEAYAKARGSGIGRLLQPIALSGPAALQSPLRAAEAASALRTREGLSVHDLALAHGLYGAAACDEGRLLLMADFPADARPDWVSDRRTLT